jgi:hypothetical protein
MTPPRPPRRSASSPARKPLWRCPKCGARFTTRNQQHSCGTFDLDALFARSAPLVRELFDRFSALVAAAGPVTVIPQKTRVAFQVRMRFAAVSPRKQALVGHLVMRERHDEPCFETVEKLGNCYRHAFRATRLSDLTPLRRWIRRSYVTGQQRDL